jgi:TPR repeat protein
MIRKKTAYRANLSFGAIFNSDEEKYIKAKLDELRLGVPFRRREMLVLSFLLLSLSIGCAGTASKNDLSERACVRASISDEKKAAEQGEAKAQFCLGMAYFKGQGVARDNAQRVGWTSEAPSDHCAVRREAAVILKLAMLRIA